MGSSEKKRSNLYTGFIIAVVLAVIGFIGSRAYLYSKGNNFTISTSGIDITGLGKRTIQFKDVDKIELSKTIPVIKTRLMGSEVGSKKRGTFSLESLGICILYINTDIKLYVIIYTGDKPIIINYTDESKTETLYNEIKNSFDVFKQNSK